ncbi:MAG TPA: acyl-CoA desaturase [Gammaproteobacteria bacterium]|jgi:stearoyl-CoA desaturase (delta-9 desaturase)|nr:acyl-CoA desaturase [Gammaproteobacteria bacterium]
MKALWQTSLKWFASDNQYDPHVQYPEEIDWMRAIPFILLNLGCFAVFWVGFSWTAFIVAAVLYFVRLFSIGAFYHRYFSHRTFQTSRAAQFVFALFAASCVQRGPLWWASHHRQHHMVSDEPADAHSPIQHGFWWSHVGWFLSKKHYHYNPERVRDLAKFPELVFLDKYDNLVPTILFISLLGIGSLLHHYAPQLGVTGPQLLVWGFCISTIALFNSTVVINSLCHMFGRKRFNTADSSRNSLLLALLTLGEGWHNNHHHYPATARQGFMWWEIDITYYVIKLMEKLGIVWDVRGVPHSVLQKDLVKTANTRPLEVSPDEVEQS